MAPGNVQTAGVASGASERASLALPGRVGCLIGEVVRHERLPVDMADRSGELARLCEILATRGVNLVICGVAHGDRGAVAFIADDENAARDALQAAEIDYVGREAVTVRLQNVPGAGAATFRRLLEANVNLEVFLPVRIFDDEFYAVICPDNVAAALAALGDQVAAT
jgi:hypothetical protein